MDKIYFSVESSELDKSKGVSVRGASCKTNLAVIEESISLDDIELVEM